MLFLCLGHPISDELSESMSSHVTRLEVENDKLKHELEEIKAKLYNTQQEVEKLLKQSENDYKKKLQESERDHRKQFQNIKKEVSEELHKRFEIQTSELQGALSEKADMIKKYQVRSSQFEKDKLMLAEQVKGLEDQLRCSRHQRDELNSKMEKYKHELQLCNSRLRVCQDSQQSWDSLQGEKADLVQELTNHKDQLHQEKTLLKKVQRENDDLLQQLKTQQEHWRKDKEHCARLHQEKKVLESERHELRNNLDTVRECSDEHIRQLEEQLFALQDKSVAIENLNDYLNNLSVMDNSVDDSQQTRIQTVYDTDLDAHLSTPSSSCNVSFSSVDNNHNDKNTAKFSVSHNNTESDSNRNRLTRIGRNEVRSRGNVSVGSHDRPSLNASVDQTPPRISYVKRNGSSKNSNGSAVSETEKSGSQKFLSRLKSYVKSPKPETTSSNNQDSQTSGRASLRGVQLRQENASFVRNSRHRSTIHGHPLKDTSQLVKQSHSPAIQPKNHRPMSASFHRSHPLRQTMPERRTTVHGSAGSSQYSDGSHNNSFNSLSQSRESVFGSHCSSSHHKSHNNNPSLYHDASSDFDSGLDAFSEGNPSVHNTSRYHHQESSSQESVECQRLVTSIQVISTEIVETYRKLSNGKSAEKVNQLADKLTYLQGKYQSVVADNAKLRQFLQGGSTGTLADLEKRTHELEAENRKLRLIVETLQNTLSGRNPYDDKEYHYFTNV